MSNVNHLQVKLSNIWQQLQTCALVAKGEVNRENVDEFSQIINATVASCAADITIGDTIRGLFKRNPSEFKQYIIDTNQQYLSLLNDGSLTCELLNVPKGIHITWSLMRGEFIISNENDPEYESTFTQYNSRKHNHKRANVQRRGTGNTNQRGSHDNRRYQRGGASNYREHGYHGANNTRVGGNTTNRRYNNTNTRNRTHEAHRPVLNETVYLNVLSDINTVRNNYCEQNQTVDVKNVEKTESKTTSNELSACTTADSNQSWADLMEDELDCRDWVDVPNEKK